MAGSTQIRNSEQVNLLRADFQPRYEPNFAWKSAVSALLALPGLRAAWSMSSVDYAAATQARDVSGGAYHLTNNNTATFGYWANSLIPCVTFDGVNQNLTRADGGAGNWADIIGTEAYIAAGQRGLTLGCWVNAASFVALLPFIFDKLNAYYIYFGGAGNNQPAFQLFDTIGGFPVVTSTTVCTATAWYFVCGRFTPGTMDIYVNDSLTSAAAAGSVAIVDSAGQFTIGSSGAPGNYFSGSMSLCFLCAASLSDSIIKAFYQQTRAMYGV